MSDLAKSARKAMHEKAKRYAACDPAQKVDASGYRTPAPMEGDEQTGAKPTVARKFKRGGKVEGEHGPKHAGRKPRAKKADGGGTVPTERFAFSPTTGSSMMRNAGLKRGGAAKHGDEKQDVALIKREVKAEALKRRPHKDIGGSLEMLSPALALANGLRGNGGDKDNDDAQAKKRGGRAERKHGGRADAHWIKGAVEHKGALHKELHVPEGDKIPEKRLEKAEHSSNKMVAKRAHLAETLRDMRHHDCDGGRVARKSGGRAGKGKMNVNIVIATGKDQPQGQPQMQAPQPMPPRPMPMAPAPQAPQGMPMLPPQAGPGGPGGPPMPPPMPRKRGGRTHLDAGAGSGEGRMEKIDLQR